MSLGFHGQRSNCMEKDIFCWTQYCWKRIYAAELVSWDESLVKLNWEQNWSLKVLVQKMCKDWTICIYPPKKKKCEDWTICNWYHILALLLSVDS